MKSTHWLIIMFAFVLVTVFGFLSMGSHHGPMQNCLASVVGQSPCPENDPLGYASFHLNFFKIFSSVPGFGLVSLALVWAVSVLLFYFFRVLAIPAPLKIRAFYSSNDLIVFDTYHHDFFRWFSFHENSPSSLCGNTA